MPNLLDATRKFLPGEDVRYVFLGQRALNPVLASLLSLLDFVQITPPGARQFRVIAITPSEIIVMKAGNWVSTSRRKPRQILYRSPRRNLGPLTDRPSSVIEIGEERIRVRRRAYWVIDRANAELAH